MDLGGTSTRNWTQRVWGHRVASFCGMFWGYIRRFGALGEVQPLALFSKLIVKKVSWSFLELLLKTSCMGH